VKIQAMKTILAHMLNGEGLNSLLMHVIRFVMPSKNKALKKLCVLYWEICQKRQPDGTPRPEMVLVCNALRNDLISPNEFVRGQCLRFLCKLKEEDLLEPLVPSVRQCLDHKHPYVRKNAVLAIFSIFKLYPKLIPDANEFIEQYLSKEQDQSARRNALVMLMNTALPVAIQYYHKVAAEIPSLEPQLQTLFVEIIRKDARNPNADKAKYIQTIISLLTVSSASVRYEAAGTLTYLSSHASAIKAACQCYVELAYKESDNNVKLIVLQQIQELHKSHERVLDGAIMDILRIIASPDFLVRKKCLALAMEFLNNQNVDEVVQFLKKELLKTHDQEYEKNSEYRQLLIQTIHQCAIKFPKVADSIVDVLMDFLNDSNKVSSIDVIAFVKEVMERFPHLRNHIIESLLDVFLEMKASRTLRGALWILGEYCQDPTSIVRCLERIKESLGSIPIMGPEDMNGHAEPSSPTRAAAKKILADGSYASETVFSAATKSPTTPQVKKPLRHLIFVGDFYVCAVLATCLTKLALRFSQIVKEKGQVNSFNTQAMLIMTSIIRAGRTKSQQQIDEDSYNRILTCLQILSMEPKNPAIVAAFLQDTRDVFSKLLISRAKPATKKASKVKVQEPIAFRMLKTKKAEVEDDNQDMLRATGLLDDQEQYVSKLERIFPLSGYTDPIYCEAYVNVHQFDIIVDILMINQTPDTMQNVTVEFTTMGDVKLVEKPAPYTIGPHGFHSVKLNFKNSSTESGIIFGTIVYDGERINDFHTVILNDIHIDIMEYIRPATCNETKFKQMWDEFEWENRINVTTNLTKLKDYLEFVLRITNMKCLTPFNDEDCGFLAANLYAQSIFGEDCLCNLCLEETNGVISGHLRIRSKTQGIALALGEKVGVI
jgi:coatomer subunit beta